MSEGDCCSGRAKEEKEPLLAPSQVHTQPLGANSRLDEPVSLKSSRRGGKSIAEAVQSTLSDAWRAEGGGDRFFGGCWHPRGVEREADSVKGVQPQGMSVQCTSLLRAQQCVSDFKALARRQFDRPEESFGVQILRDVQPRLKVLWDCFEA